VRQVEESREGWTPENAQFKGRRQQSASHWDLRDEIIQEKSCPHVLMNSGRFRTVPTYRDEHRKFKSHGSGFRDARIDQTHESLSHNPKEDSRMSDLKVYWPDSEPVSTEPMPAKRAETSSVSSEPEIYSFTEWVDKLRGPDSNPAALRAQRLNVNQTCPDCSRAGGVLPLMLNDGRMDGSGRLVPGSATLVGFRCESCSHEWPV
jgi:hypothetical protein